MYSGAGGVLGGRRGGSAAGAAGSRGGRRVRKRPHSAGPTATMLENVSADEAANVSAMMGMSVEALAELDAQAQDDTDAAMEAYAEEFERHDADGSGTISPDELRMVMESLGEDMTEEDFQKLLVEVDKDGDGEVDYEEFVNMMRARKRVEALAGSITKARSGYTEPATPESLYPKSQPALPPLNLQSIQGQDRRRRKKYVRDRYYTRDTPHVLRLGAAASSDELKQELRLAQALVNKLDHAVKEDVKWVQANCPVSSIRAQMYCKRWGMEKLTKLMAKLEKKKESSAFHKWRGVLELMRNEAKVDSYLKWKASRGMSALMQNWQNRHVAGAWRRWDEEVRRLLMGERQAAAGVIQRAGRGLLGRSRARRILRNLASVDIQRVGRGLFGRRRARWARHLHQEEKAAGILQSAWRGHDGRKQVSLLRQSKEEQGAATKLQCMFRGRGARQAVNGKRHVREENDAATKLQCLYRGRGDRQKLSKVKRDKEEAAAATYIQTRWRGHTGKRRAFEVMEGRLQAEAEDNAALVVQGAWRCKKAEQSVHEKRVIRAALRIQCRWRIRQGGLALHLKRQAKAQLLIEQQEAALRIQAIHRGRKGRRAYVSKRANMLHGEEEKSAALRIQNMQRGKNARRDMLKRRAQREAAELRKAEEALMVQMAVRVQCAWRAKNGRFAYNLKKQAMRMRREEEAEKAAQIQALYRGKQARAALAEKREQGAAATKMQCLYRGRQGRADFLEHREQSQAAGTVQNAFRGKQARKEVAYRRKLHADAEYAESERLRIESWEKAEAKRIEEERVHQELVQAAVRVQCAWRAKNGRFAYNLKKQAMRMRREEEAEAATKLQSMMRGKQARREVQDRRELRERELVRAKKEREKASVVIQNRVRGKKAKGELARRREAKRLQEEEVEQSGAALKIQGKFRMKGAKKKVGKLRADKQAKADREANAGRERAKEARGATKIQSLRRGKIARQEVGEKRAKVKAQKAAAAAEEKKRAEKREQNGAATKLQGMYRGKQSRRETGKRRKERKGALVELEREKAAADEIANLQDEQEKELAATRMQGLYRGKKARQKVGSRRVKKKKADANRAERVKGNKAATKIQAMHRGNRARRGKGSAPGRGPPRKRQGSAAESKGGGGSAWVEYFDESAQVYYYFNTETQETSWETPADYNGGYNTAGSATDYDTDNYASGYDTAGSVTDYGAHNAHAQGLFCIECEVTAAAQYCNECADNFCDACFADTHQKGRKRTHTTVAAYIDADGDGIDDRYQEVKETPKCTGCGFDSVYWCNECSDYMCENCWHSNHATPALGGHTFMLAFMDDDGNGVDDRARADYDWSGWEHMFDNTKQVNYWYNPGTGETQWI